MPQSSWQKSPIPPATHRYYRNQGGVHRKPSRGSATSHTSQKTVGTSTKQRCGPASPMLACISSLHVILALLLVELAFLLGSGILVLLVLGHKVVHVRLSFSELHFIHALSGVPPC